MYYLIHGRYKQYNSKVLGKEKIYSETATGSNLKESIIVAYGRNAVVSLSYCKLGSPVWAAACDKGPVAAATRSRDQGADNTADANK